MKTKNQFLSIPFLCGKPTLPQPAKIVSADAFLKNYINIETPTSVDCFADCVKKNNK